MDPVTTPSTFVAAVRAHAWETEVSRFPMGTAGTVVGVVCASEGATATIAESDAQEDENTPPGSTIIGTDVKRKRREICAVEWHRSVVDPIVYVLHMGMQGESAWIER